MMLGKTDRETIAQLRGKGMVIREISELTGRSPTTVWKVLVELGPRGIRPKKWRPRSEKDHPKIIKLRLSGMSVKKISEQTGWSVSLIWNVINFYNLPVQIWRAPTSRALWPEPESKADHPKIILLWKAGMSARAISKEVKWSLPVIYKALKANDIPLRKYGKAA